MEGITGQPLVRWTQFVLMRDEYKSNLKTITLEDRTTGLAIELTAQIKATE